ncbi:hypothetical protein K2173_021844 [Erythroxylum novogranatense]|uniref:Uncharacterized protein n=1 Tax=Erythroxylum novogranatense TaxID=1862640 RepID=A0AAV8T222_9ROSI|nr:hypothetical protein K2173_021844 [Erythroxylum novogranatense]
MATSRIARFISEVAPPQYISVMRSRASKMLDTISEEDRDAAANDSPVASFKSPTSSASCSSCCATAANTTATNSKYFLRGVQKSLFLP